MKREKVTMGEGVGRRTYEFDVSAGKAHFVTSYYGGDHPRFNTGPGGPAPDNAPATFGKPGDVETAANVAANRRATSEKRP